jgi:DNA-binding PadR family transcriptional regulator
MIGRHEETLLLAIEGLGGESYSSEIHEHIQRYTGRDLSPGSILTGLYRMEEKGFLSSRFSDPLPERGGRRRRMFRIEGLGQQAIRDREMLDALRAAKRAEVTL